MKHPAVDETEIKMPGQVQEIIAEIEDHRRAFEDWCRSLSPQELARPVPDSTWRVRQRLP